MTKDKIREEYDPMSCKSLSQLMTLYGIVNVKKKKPITTLTLIVNFYLICSNTRYLNLRDLL